MVVRLKVVVRLIFRFVPSDVPKKNTTFTVLAKFLTLFPTFFRTLPEALNKVMLLLSILITCLLGSMMGSQMCVMNTKLANQFLYLLLTESAIRSFQLSTQTRFTGH